MEFENFLSINLLDDDLLVEVLSRLPPESVMRCKSVSRHWRYLLSSPYFFRRYAVANSGCAGRLLAFFQKSARVYLAWEEPAKGMSCDTLYLPNKLIGENNIPRQQVGYFVNSSNGLILFSRGRHQIIYHIGNPLTGKFVELPLTPKGRCNFITFGEMTSLKTPALKSSVLICEQGNSYEPPAYSVLRAGMMNKFKEPEDFKTLYIESYSSRTGKWSPMTRLTLTSQTFYLSRQPAVVANGVVHWYTLPINILVYDPRGGDPKLQFINVPKIKKCLEKKWFSFTRTYDDVMWFGLLHRRGLTFYMLPKQGATATECVDAKEWVEMAEVSFDQLGRMMKKGLVACNYKEVTLEYLIPESGSEVVAVLQQKGTMFLYNVHRESLVKVDDYSGSYNENCYLCPYLQSSSLSSYCL